MRSSKATGVPLAKLAARLMIGWRLADFDLLDELTVDRFFIKTPVFPFVKFPGVDPILGPEMRSTGEVMGAAEDFGGAFLKAQQGAGIKLPGKGTIFIAVNNHDKHAVVDLARQIYQLGFKLVATRGTQRKIASADIPCDVVYKVNEGRPNILDLIKNRQIDLVITTPLGGASFNDQRAVRCAAMQYNVPCITTMSGAMATVAAIRALNQGQLEVHSLQEYHAQAARKEVPSLRQKLISQTEAFQRGSIQSIKPGDGILDLTDRSASGRFSGSGKVTVAEALAQLPRLNGQSFVSVFEHGTLVAEILAPPSSSPLHPHPRDEIYIVARGSGELFRGGVCLPISPGDFLFVPAGVEHHFRNFTDDLIIWAIFYGPEGGEADSAKSKAAKSKGDAD